MNKAAQLFLASMALTRSLTTSVVAVVVLCPDLNPDWFILRIQLSDKKEQSCTLMSRHDMFHLSFWLSSTPSRFRPSSPLSPVYLNRWSLFVCCQFVLFVKSASIFVSAPAFSQSLFSCPGLTLGCPDCEPTRYHSAWAFLPSCTFAPSLDLPTSAWPDPEHAYLPAFLL